MMDVKKVVKKIVDYKQQNSHLKKVTLDNEVVYAPFHKDKEKNNYGFMVFSEEETEIKSDCKYKHRYYYYEEFKEDNECENIIFIMFNPSTASPDKDDQTIKNCRTLVEKKYKSMEIINLFSERSSKESKFADDDLKNNNLDFIKEFLKIYKNNQNEQEVVIAWGYAKDKAYPQKIKKINEQLKGFTKKKIILKDGALEEAQNLARHPNQPFWKGFGEIPFDKIAEITEY